MLIPDKYEDIQYNVLAAGAKILSMLKKKPMHIMELYQKLLSVLPEMDLELYYDILTFLWFTGCITYKYNTIGLMNYNKDKKG